MKDKKPETVSSSSSNSAAIWLAVISGIVAITIALIQFNPWKGASEKGPEPVKQQYRLFVIAGTVVDEASNRSIGMAEVSVVGRTETYVTEENGNFRIELKNVDPSPEQFRIRVAKPGYRIYDQALTPPVEDVVIALKKEVIK